MVSIKKYFCADVCHDAQGQLHDTISYYISDPALIRSVSLTGIEAKVVVTKDFDSNYARLLDYGYAQGSALIDYFFDHGFSAWIFERGPFLTSTRLASIKNYAPFGHLRASGLVTALNRQKCYEFSDGCQYAGVFSVGREAFYNACVYVQGRTYTVMLLTTRNASLSEGYLDTLFSSTAFAQCNGIDCRINWLSLCLTVCPHGDVVFMIDGAYDDLYRSLCFYYCQEALDSNVRERLLAGAELRP